MRIDTNQNHCYAENMKRWALYISIGIFTGFLLCTDKPTEQEVRQDDISVSANMIRLHRKTEDGSLTGIVETMGTVKDIWVEKADYMLNKLPENVLDHFVDSGYHFYITDEEIAQTEYDGMFEHVAGVTRYGKYIKIEDRQYAIDEALLHEFGHFVFDECGNWNRRDMLDAFYQDVSNAALMDITYGLDDAGEFYAEVFQKYVKNPEETGKIFPNLTLIIQEDMDSL